MPAQKNNLTVLFVDVSDNSRLYESLGDAAAYREVRECMTMLGEVVTKHQGRVIKPVGDGALCSFTTADLALTAACEMQNRVQMRQPVRDCKISIRIGLHHGPVLLTGDDIFGDSVNTAARMVQLAASGQIITTGETHQLISGHHHGSMRRLDSLPVKGKHKEVTVYEVLWQVTMDHTQMPGWLAAAVAQAQSQADTARLRLHFEGSDTLIVDAIDLGRQGSNGIVLKDLMASRNHARIERRKDKFVLIDRSTNGTFVKMNDGKEFKLRREEMILYGSGVIAFGHHTDEKDGDVVGFRCESGAGASVDDPQTRPRAD
jgi:adenylate cyclase